MKINWLLIGIIYVIAPFIWCIFEWGQLQEAYTVDLNLIFAGIGATIVPFVLGWLAGKYDAQPSTRR